MSVAGAPGEMMTPDEVPHWVDASTPSPVVEAICTAIDAVDVLNRIDPESLDPEELDILMAWSLKLAHMCHAAARRVAPTFEMTGRGTVGRFRNAAGRLARLANMTRREAGRVLTHGRQLQQMPMAAWSLQRGDISIDHVDRLAACTARQRLDSYRRDEAELVAAAETLRFDQFAKAAAYWRNDTDRELGDEGNEPCAERQLTHRPGVFGEHHLNADLDPVGGAEVVKAIETIADELATGDKQSAGQPCRTRKQLRADALVEMARRAMAMPKGARKSRPLVTVVVGQDEFKRLCELSNGVVIGPNQLVPHLDAIDIETLIFDGHFTGISKSSQRGFTGAVRRVVEVRDRHCQHESGCDEPIDRCDVDHVIPVHRGGITEQHDGRLKCTYHNRIEPPYCTPPPPKPPDL